MNLKLTGTQTITLTNGTDAIITDFKPGKDTLEVKEVELFADVVLLGSRATIQTAKDNIDAILSAARSAQLDLSLTKICVEVDTGDGYLRSEVVDGNLETDNDFFDRVARNHAPVRLWLKRKNYWEGAEAQIPLTNENGMNNTTGLTVYNTNDMTGTAPTKRVNYVKMVAANVTGSIPTPPRIEMTNTYDPVIPNQRLSNIWMGLSIDDATYPLTWFIDQTVPLNWAYDTETQISLTTLTTAFLNGANGAHYRVFTKMWTGTQYMRLNAALYFPASVALTPMQKAPEIVTSFGNLIIDLGTLQIPPWLPNVKNQEEIGLRIGGRCTGGFNVQLSDIFLFPANAFRHLMPRGYGIATSVRLVYDGIIDRVWTDGWTGTAKTGHYSGYGDLIKLTPGKDQRLLFLNDTMTGGIDDDQTMSIKLFYRPRRLTP